MIPKFKPMTNDWNRGITIFFLNPDQKVPYGNMTRAYTPLQFLHCNLSGNSTISRLFLCLSQARKITTNCLWSILEPIDDYLLTRSQSKGVITSTLVNVTSAANSTCTQTRQTGLTTFPDVKVATSSLYSTTSVAQATGRSDCILLAMIGLNRRWLTGCRFDTAGVRDDFLCTRLSIRGLRRLISCSRPYLLLENPKFFIANKEEINAVIRVDPQV